jgi:hypothetical protein
MNQKTSWWLKRIGIVLVAGSLWPAARVALAALKPPLAITLTPLAAIDKDNDKAVYKNTGVDKDKYQTPVTSPDVIVNFVTTAETPLNPGFSGFNSNLQNAVEYYDPNFQQILKTLSPGWLRFPGGTESEAFDWASGEIELPWVDILTKTNTHDINLAAQPIVAGKGGSSFSDFAAMARNVGGAKIIVSVNAYTDTPQSAQAFAQYARTNNIPVAVWELANEPYTWLPNPNATPSPFPGQFFTTPKDYADKMKSYRDAIKAGDPNAVVSLYYSEAGTPDKNWDKALANYSPRYWDAVTYHEYVHPLNPTTFDDLMAAANGNLLSRTTSHVTDYLMANPLNEPGPYVVSEVSPSPGEAGKGLVLLGTLYGGIYTAEFALRMSTLPQVKYVASFQVLSNAGAGIDVTNDPSAAVTAQYKKDGTTTNTSGFDFGFFLSAQAAGEAVANGALHNSIGVYTTTTTGGPTVPTDDGQSLPAVYAQAYEGGNGKRYVVLTNKGASTEVAQIMQDGVVRMNQMLMTFVTGTDPSLANSSPPPNNVQIQTQTVTNPGAVTIPPYSVVRLEWYVNLIDDTGVFVGQQYLDFLNREPDPSGLAFWISQITSCGTDQQCIDVKRINTSGAFFLSIEFQQTGYLVERAYKVAFGDSHGSSTIGGTHQLAVPIVNFNQFVPDTAAIGQGLVVGQTGWETVLENNKQAYFSDFVQRSRFKTAFPTTLTPAQFIDALFANAGVTPTASDRTAVINEFGSATTTTDAAARGRAVRRVAENATLNTQEFNRAFVLMQYFGYLRRDPNSGPDTDWSGYDFWLKKLNQFNGNFLDAEMVKAFLTSTEYRQRFGP